MTAWPVSFVNGIRICMSSGPVLINSVQAPSVLLWAGLQTNAVVHNTLKKAGSSLLKNYCVSTGRA